MSQEPTIFWILKSERKLANVAKANRVEKLLTCKLGVEAQLLDDASILAACNEDQHMRNRRHDWVVTH